MREGCRQSSSWRRFAGVLAGLCLTLGFGSGRDLYAADAELAEYQVKAAYLYNFISFTEWPAATGAELRLCVYGPDPFGPEIDTLQGKNIGGRTLVVARVTSVELLESCQAVFLAREVISNLPRILDALRGRTILTIADSPGAVRDGVAINMLNDVDRVSFEVNLDAAQRQGLNLSFRLLRLATEVLN
jgi:hypothetical protein